MSLLSSSVSLMEEWFDASSFDKIWRRKGPSYYRHVHYLS
jgi:hypothetical protein